MARLAGPGGGVRLGPVGWAAGLIGAAVGLFLFDRWLGFGLLNPASGFWRVPPGDSAIMMAGFEAAIRAPWSFPLGVVHSLDAPDATSIVYTDSIPWLTLALKALGLGQAVNPLALFLAASYVLQPLAMVALLRACGVERLATLLAGALLALLTPVWLLRHHHVALTAHWLEIGALALSIGAAREGLTWRRAAAFVGLGALATGIHAYHVLPIALLMLAGAASDVAQRRAGSLVTGAAGLAAFAGAVGLSAWVLGYGVGEAPFGDAATLGYFATNLAGPLYPQGSTLFGQTFNGGWFDHVLDPSGHGAFEGYAYLGGGLILLAFAALLIAVRTGQRQSGWWLRFGPLVLALIALAVLATGPIFRLGWQPLFRVPLAEQMPWWTIFRSSGRFFWAVTYAVTAASLVVVDRRVARMPAALLLAAAVIVQFVDVREVRREVVHAFALPEVALYADRLASDRALGGRPWNFALPFVCTPDVTDREAISQLTLVALRLGSTVTGSGAARMTPRDCRPGPALGQPAAPGDRRVLVALRGSLGPAYAAVAARPDCRPFTRGMICGADLGDVGATRELGAWRFDGGQPSPLLTAGWAPPDPNGVWSTGKQAQVVLPPVTRDPARPLLVELAALSFAPPPAVGQRITVTAKGRTLAVWDVRANLYKPYRVELPAEMFAEGEPITLGFAIPNPTRPSAEDPRTIGLGLQSLTVFQ